MPVFWNVFHSAREVVISVQGVVHLKEMEECVDGILTPATRSYRKLVNMVEGRWALSPEDIAALAEYVRERRGDGPTGAVAIAVGSDESEQQMRLFDSQSVADRPLEIFRDTEAARAWLNNQPTRAPPPWLDEATSSAQQHEP